MNNVFPAFVIVTIIIGALVLMIYDVNVRDPRRRAEEAAKAEVLVNGHAKAVHTLVDRKTGRTLRIVTIDGNPLILSDEPTPLEKE